MAEPLSIVDVMQPTLVAKPFLKWLKVNQPKYREGERGFYKP